MPCEIPLSEPECSGGHQRVGFGFFSSEISSFTDWSGSLVHLVGSQRANLITNIAGLLYITILPRNTNSKK